MTKPADECNFGMYIYIQQYLHWHMLSSDWGKLFLTDPTEYVSLTPHLRTETYPVSETLCSLEYWTIGKVQKPSNTECYTPS
jgi:hypothetical protein